MIKKKEVHEDKKQKSDVSLLRNEQQRDAAD